MLKFYLKKYLPELPRLLLAVTFTLSAIGKIADSEQAEYLIELMASYIFWLVEWKTEIVWVVILIELILAILLFTKKNLTPTYIFAFLFVGMFTGVTSFFLINDFQVESCGCFGIFDIAGGLEVTLVRNIVLLLLIVAGIAIHLSGKKPVNPSE